MGTTQFYGLGFFDFGDDLESSLNVQKEIDRFVLIDKQIYALYNVFGNGVISGWEVSDRGYSNETGIAVVVSPGIGIIKYLAAETTFSETVDGLPPNSIFHLYAVLQGRTVQNRLVNFIISSNNIDNEFSLKLATITTGDNAVSTIDNTVRDLISFDEVIREQIDAHKHRGSPTKIDLQNEVKNQLPGARIEGIDASKIVSGTFDIERFPSIDHNDLENNGLLTHAALDTLSRSLTQSNRELLGEIASINLLKQLIFLKYKFDVHNTAYVIDEHFVNEFAIIPGITPDAYIDFSASTAQINLQEHCISGKPAKIGVFTSVYWDSQQSFEGAESYSDVIISGGNVSLSRDYTLTDVIENFEGATRPGQPIPGFSKSVVILNDDSEIVAEGSDVNKIEGFYSGSFTSSATIRSKFTKIFASSRNWTNYNELVFDVKCSVVSHDPVYGYFVHVDENGVEYEREFTILSTNQTTFNEDSSKNNFETVVVDISSWDRSNITKVVIYTDENDENFVFYLDNMFVRRENLVVSEGYIKLRHEAQTPVTFYSVLYDAIVPANTELRVRVRVANSEDLLERSGYSLPLNNGDIFAIIGTTAEIEIVLTSSDGQSTPILDSVELRMLVEASFHGFDINTADEWNRGDIHNITVSQSASSTLDSDLSISSYVNVDGLSFSVKDIISEITDEGVAIYGISGKNMPISPLQAANWAYYPAHKFDDILSIVRKYDKHFLVADSKNHRVIEVDGDGTFIRGFASTYINSSVFYPSNACYNSSKGILTIVCTSSSIVADITKIVYYVSGAPTKLTSNDTILSTNKGQGKVIEIQLGTVNIARLAGLTSGLTVDFEVGAFNNEIEKDFNATKLYGLYGIECFVGDLTYMDGIKTPVFVDILSSGNWVVANAYIIYTEAGEDTTLENTNVSFPSIIEFKPLTLETIFTTDKILFSEFTLGSIVEISSTRWVVAALGPFSGALDSIIPNANISLFATAALEALHDYRAGIFIIDKPSDTPKLQYTSPDGLYVSDISMSSDGEFLASESAFANASGRLIKLDSFWNIIWMYGNGALNAVNDAKIMSNGHMIVSV